jgi:hypothetical protein
MSRTPVDVALRRVFRFRRLLQAGAPAALVEVERDLVKRGFASLEPEEILEFAIRFASTWASERPS